MTAVLFVLQGGKKKIVEEKKIKNYGVLLDKLISSVKNQKDFWESILKIAPKRNSFCNNNISLKSWFMHFRALLQKEIDFYFGDESAVHDNESSLSRPNFQGRSLACIQKVAE